MKDSLKCLSDLIFLQNKSLQVICYALPRPSTGEQRSIHSRATAQHSLNHNALFLQFLTFPCNRIASNASFNILINYHQNANLYGQEPSRSVSCVRYPRTVKVLSTLDEVS